MDVVSSSVCGCIFAAYHWRMRGDIRFLLGLAYSPV
jgi:hypothetical protein